MPVFLSRPRIMKWNTSIVTDHNRGELSIAYEQIEKSNRMWDGTLRKYYINTKRTFSTSWDMLPRTGEVVGDGLNGKGIEDFYNANKGAFTLTTYSGDGTAETYTVMFQSISKTVVKRGVVDFLNMTVELVEV